MALPRVFARVRARKTGADAPPGIAAPRSAAVVAAANGEANTTSGKSQRRNYIELEGFTWSVQEELYAIDPQASSDLGPVASGVLYGLGADGKDVIQVRAAGSVAEALLSLPPSSHVLVKGLLAVPRSLPPPVPFGADGPVPPPTPPPPYIWATSVTLLQPTASPELNTSRATSDTGGGASSFESSSDTSGFGSSGTTRNSTAGRSAQKAAASPAAAGVAFSGAGGGGGGSRSVQVVAYWEELRSGPTDWWDNRLDKMNGRAKPNSPDFRAKSDRAKAVWIVDRDAPSWVGEWLQQHPPGSLAGTSTITAGGTTGTTGAGAGQGSNEDALWEDLRQNPDKWWDNRTRKTNPKAPDFKQKESGAGLWLTGRRPLPAWVPKFLSFLDSRDDK
ncbi:hypothetical protein HYH02_003031 [Chlamydomonas schloesseri]|uniref:Uncharacterized protein n=1 Tax=Chlamydomonas schloesseri TaxID=2026947 RepID=A0A835WRX3_9CHLO|nr:hypothetical protein HYH02_003031 [Chlamydomonas schloesseri]|eukprot:KAG2452802.1 hypothetical protein HYH02_003031 [Chlamydomonas schloesseri]